MVFVYLHFRRKYGLKKYGCTWRNNFLTCTGAYWALSWTPLRHSVHWFYCGAHCVFVGLISWEAALCLYRSTITIILARTIIMGLSYRVHMLPWWSFKTRAWRIWRILSFWLLNGNHSESAASKLWEIVERIASAHRLNLPRTPVQMITSNLEWSPNVVEEKLARVYEVHAHLVEYPAVWWCCCM